MRSTFVSSLFAAVILASSTVAEIASISAPASVKHGASVTVKITTKTAATTVIEHYGVWGWRKTSTTACADCLGDQAAVTNFDFEDHNDTGNGSFKETIPAPSSKGTYELVLAVLTQTGAERIMSTEIHKTAVKIS